MLDDVFENDLGGFLGLLLEHPGILGFRLIRIGDRRKPVLNRGHFRVGY